MFVECRSFSDLSNRSAVSEELPWNTTVNVVNTNNKVYTEAKNVSLTDVVNGTFDAGYNNLNETAILSTGGNTTFNCDEVPEQFVYNEMQEKKLSLIFENDQQGASEEFNKTPTNIEVQEPVAVAETIKSPVLPETTSKIEETAAKQPEVIAEVQEARAPKEEPSMPEMSSLEAPTQTSESTTQEVEISSKSEFQESIKSVNEEAETPTKLAEPEIVYRNIDEIHCHDDKPEPMDFETSPDAPSTPDSDNLHASEDSSVTSAGKFILPAVPKLNENYFVDKMLNQFDVEFKMPSAPVLKQPNDNYSHEEFKTCGSSCKI